MMRRFVLLGGVALIVGLFALSASPALAQSDDGPLGCGIVWDSTITYTVEAGSSSVGVEGESILTYPASASPLCVTDEIVIPVPPAIFGMVAHGPAGIDLPTTIDLPEEEGRSALARIGLPSQLDPGESHRVSFSYWMPDDGAFTIAAAEQVAFNAWVWGSPSHISLRVVAEPGDTVVAGTPTQPVTMAASPGLHVYPAISNPDDWIGSTSIFRGPERTAIRATGSGYPTTLHAIDGGSGWVEAAESDIAVGIPTLEGLVGINWPQWKPLDVIEVRDQTLDGYAGRYLPAFHAIQLPTDTPQGTMLHELGHAWFNGDLFADQWVNEGFAELYAYIAEARIPDTDGFEPTPALPVAADESGSIPLTMWEAADSVGAGTEATVEYGYRASYWVLSQIEDEIGADAMSAVVVAAMSEAAENGEAVSSTRLLGLLETIGGSQRARKLFAEYGGAEDGRTAAEQSAALDVEPGVQPILDVPTGGSRGLSPVVLIAILLPVAAGFGMIFMSKRRSPKRTVASHNGPRMGQAAPSGISLDGVPSYLTTAEDAEGKADPPSNAGADAPWVH